jgi:yhgE/pip C-terminal domain protein (fragment)
VLAVVQAALAGALALAGVRFGNVWAAGGLLLVGALAMTVLHAALMAALGARGASAISLLALAAQAVWVLAVGASGGPSAPSVPSVPSGIAGVLPATVLDSALSGVMLGTADSSGRATSLAVLRREPAAA